MAASYPNGIKEFDPNTDNVTVVNADYMNQRDEEIEAIEKALGIGLVPGSGGSPMFSLASCLKVDASGNLILATGCSTKVGIGTGDPQARLEVLGPGGFRLFAGKETDFTMGAPGSKLQQVAGTSYGVPYETTGEVVGGYGLAWGSNVASPIVWMYNGDNDNAFQVRVKSFNQPVNAAPVLFHVGKLGNVGIGTTSPAEKLHVNGNVRIADTLAFQSGEAIIGNGGYLYLVAGLTQISQSAIVSGSLSVQGCVDFQNSLHVNSGINANSLSTTNGVSIGTTLDIGSTTTIGGSTSIAGSLVVNGCAEFHSSLTVTSGVNAGSLSVTGTLAHQGGSLGFYGAGAQSQPTVSGSRGSNAALTSLLGQLASLGLIINNTTA